MVAGDQLASARDCRSPLPAVRIAAHAHRHRHSFDLRWAVPGGGYNFEDGEGWDN